MSIIDDGFKTTIAFSAGSSGVVLANILKERNVTPPGIEGGGPNDTTTMRNTTWRTRSPKGLKTLSAGALVCAYDPAVFDELVAMVNVNQSIVITFADLSTLTFWGWIDNAVFSEVTEGEQPTVTITIEPSNQNASGAEIAPDYAVAA